MEPNGPDHLSKRCVKCLTPMPEPEWRVNKDMVYCTDCANLLHLGESKESRLFSDMHDQEPGPPPDMLAAVPDPDGDDPEGIPS